MPKPAIRRSADPAADLHQAVLLAAVIVAAGIITMIVQALTGSLRIPVVADHVLPGGVLPGGTATELLDGVTVDPGGVVEVRVSDPTPAQQLLSILATLPTGVVVLAVLAVLARALGRSRRAEPFQADLSKGLRRLGVLCLAGGSGAWLVEFFARFVLVDTVSSTGAAAEAELLALGFWALAWLGCLALAAAVDRGRSMRTELEGLV
ncbi:MAG: hypothetical protein GXX79_11535 [Actinomycetales bacterium]|nr:hypothetical protein [Actinomycetales bacterium]